MQIKYDNVKDFFILGDEIVPQPQFQRSNYVYSDKVLQFFEFVRNINQGGAI